MTFKELVLGHLKKYGSITSMEAFQQYGNTRLSATIYLLRNDGYNIVNEEVTATNRYGKKVCFVKYRLVE